MIRTKIVELSKLPAVAYRQKLTSGGSGVTIKRYDNGLAGIASISKTSGEAIIPANVNEEFFPKEAFEEAIELTAGLPYAKRSSVNIDTVKEPQETQEEEATEEEIATIDSAEYEAIVKSYTNKKGELSYDLINKDFIQFASKSKIVSEMIENKASVDEIRDHIVKVKLESLTGNKNLTIAQTKLIVDMLDEVSPRSVFKELNQEIKKMLSK
ncbi:UNVERIFIED_CONTAM: hypothetical protein Cloal_4361 [Acetivibrio alkalicellulosi]